MAITLTKDAKKKSIASIRRYVEENMGEEIGDLKADLLLRFFLAEIAPAVYNQAIREAQTYFQERVADLDGACYEAEFGFWPKTK